MTTIRDRLIQRLDVKIKKLKASAKRLAERSIQDKNLNKKISTLSAVKTRIKAQGDKGKEENL